MDHPPGWARLRWTLDLCPLPLDRHTPSPGKLWAGCRGELIFRLVAQVGVAQPREEGRWSRDNE